MIEPPEPRAVAELVDEHGVERVVVGLPSTSAGRKAARQPSRPASVLNWKRCSRSGRHSLHGDAPGKLAHLGFAQHDGAWPWLFPWRHRNRPVFPRAERPGRHVERVWDEADRRCEYAVGASAQDAVVRAAHADIAVERGAAIHHLLIGGGDVRVCTEHGGDAPLR